MSDLPITVVPSLPAHSWEQLTSLAEALTGTASGFQVDIVDGQFVAATSWPFTEACDVQESLARLEVISEQFAVDVDCMVVDPQQYLDSILDINVDRVTIHLGSTPHIMDAVAHIKARGAKVGIALTNDRPLRELEPYIPHIDCVQVMGIAVVGAQGQPFDVRTVPRIQELREQYPELEIAVDGSVKEDTISILKEAGANRFAPGSVIAKAEDPAATFLQLQSLALS
ncbi:MAG: hypothetical protein AAGA35_02385 [Patescibacteria group bacterium]